MVDGVRSRQKALKPIITKWKEEKMEEKNKCLFADQKDEEPLSPAARLFHEPNFNCHIIAIIGCNTKINPQLIRAGLERTLIHHPRFSSVLVLDKSKTINHMKWVPATVNLDHHIHMPDLDPNMDSPDQFVEDYISHLTTATLDSLKPLWDLHILNVKIKNAEAVGILRIHHSLGDGTSLMSLVLACTRKTSDPDALPTLPTKKKVGTKIYRSRLRLRLLFKALWMIFGLLRNTLVDILVALCTCSFLKDTETTLMGAPGLNMLLSELFTELSVWMI